MLIRGLCSKVAYKRLFNKNNFQNKYLNVSIYILKYVMILNDNLVKVTKPSKNDIFKKNDF